MRTSTIIFFKREPKKIMASSNEHIYWMEKVCQSHGLFLVHTGVKEKRRLIYEVRSRAKPEETLKRGPCKECKEYLKTL